MWLLLLFVLFFNLIITKKNLWELEPISADIGHERIVFVLNENNLKRRLTVQK